MTRVATKLEQRELQPKTKPDRTTTPHKPVSEDGDDRRQKDEQPALKKGRRHGRADPVTKGLMTHF